MGIKIVVILFTIAICVLVVYVFRLRWDRNDLKQWLDHAMLKHNNAMEIVENWKASYASLSVDALAHQNELKTLVEFARESLKVDELEITIRGGVAKFFMDKVTVYRKALQEHVDVGIKLRADLDTVRLRRDKWKAEYEKLRQAMAHESQLRKTLGEEVQELDTGKTISDAVGSEAALMAGDSRIPALDYPRGELMLAASTGPHGDEAQTR